jgi:succinoglycan biosynthesis protein ExoA
MTESRNIAEDLPLVTVVMPVRNEAFFVSKSLGAVLSQDYPPELLEVIVVDGISIDGTQNAVKDAMKCHRNLKFVKNPGGIVPTAMNIGIKRAMGEFIVRVDGHTVIEPDYVRQCIAALRRTGADNVGGRMDAKGIGTTAEAISAATSSRFGVGTSRFHYSTSEQWAETVYMGAWPRSIFDKVGFFDEEMVRNQDDELNYRILDQGGKILLCPDIRSVYYNRDSFRTLWRQYFQYGLWKVRVMQKHPWQMRWRHFVPSLLVCSLVVSGGFAFLWRQSLSLFLLIVLSYALGISVATALISRKISLKATAIAPLAFVVMHTSYGSGFVMGLTRFWKRLKLPARKGKETSPGAPK